MPTDALYYGFLGVCYCFSYAGIFFLFRFFFRDTGARLTGRAIVAAIGAALSYMILTNLFYYVIPDADLQNRLLHMFAGGFLLFALCFFVERGLHIRLGRMRLFIFGFFIVTTLGVFNELAELFLYLYAGFSYAADPLDTAFDLLSNTIGACLAALCLLPFYATRK